jgi:V/A-type H+-transporting ATPase subunit E
MSKIEELTKKIYQEGITKANNEADKLKEEAQKEADKIINDAKQKSEQIIDDANNEAEDIRKKVENELKQAHQQTLRSVQQEITEMITTEVTKKPLKEAFQDSKFLKNTIETAIKNWSAEKAQMDLTLLLPKDKQKEVGEYFEASAKDLLNGKLDVEVDPDLKAGFKIGPSDGSYQISFKEDDFQNLFKKYIRPKTITLLYGEDK